MHKIMYYPYPSGTPYEVNSHHASSINTGTITVGDEFSSNKIFMFTQNMNTIIFNSPNVTGAYIDEPSNPDYVLKDYKVEFKIKSDFILEYSDKFGDYNIVGEVEILPAYLDNHSPGGKTIDQ